MSMSVRCRFDDVGPSGPRATEFSDLEEVIVARTTAEVAGALARVEAVTREGWTAAGFVAYEAAPAFDDAFVVQQHHLDAGESLPLVWFGVFASSHTVEPLRDAEPPTAGTTRASTQAGDLVGSLDPQVSEWTCDISQRGHDQALSRIHDAIVSGETYLTNYTTRFRRPWSARDDAFALYQRLASNYASGLHAYFETDDWVVMSGSPELFFDLRDNQLTVQPMKGTAPRGRWVAEDCAIAEALCQSPKERAENVMVVDLVRNDLGRIAVSGTVTVPDLCEVQRHPAVWQLSSTVVATLRPKTTLVDVFGALFPCASVTGAPKVSTMRQIAEHETSPRGVYCGAIGYVRRPKPEDALSGLEARFSVAIRTTVIDKTTQVATYGSGGGITSDSVPEVEWHELLLKADVLRAASTGSVASATLLETMRFDPADRTKTAPGIRNLDRHLVRLHGSADRFDRSCPPDLRRRLVDSVADLGPARVRLLLHPDGTATIEHHPLPEDPSAVAVVRLCIDHVPVDPADVGLFHKTTDRRRYHERSDRHFDADDVVLVNTRGEVTETTRANLAVRLDDRWCTPPIDSGLLPGVERGRLVDAGVLHERIISVAEFREAEEIATVSSLRGWTPAVLHSCLRCLAGS